MKRWIAVLLAWSPLFAQNAPVNNPVIGQVYDATLTNNVDPDGTTYRNNLVFQIVRNPDGSKTFYFYTQYCSSYLVYEVDGPFGVPVMHLEQQCTISNSSNALLWGDVEAQIGLFLDSYGDVQHRIVYGDAPAPTTSLRSSPHLATADPAPSGDPTLTMLDGFGDSLLQFDMTNFSILSQVVVPSTVGPYGVRPTLTGSQNEYWVANGPAGIAIANLASQSVTANIATPSVPPGAIPVAIVFTNDGGTAFEAFRYNSPDASGNNGLLAAFNAANQTVTSTLALKYAPSALVMSPDGLTAYLLSSAGMITYYDVLSGTADLSLSTFTPGKDGGYPGNGTPVFIHPDGTRLFWNIGPLLESFDLNAHQVTAQFNSGLPTTSGISMTLAQDGLIAIMSDGVGDEVFVDTQFGALVGTYTAPAAAQAFVGAPQP